MIAGENSELLEDNFDQTKVWDKIFRTKLERLALRTNSLSDVQALLLLKICYSAHPSIINEIIPMQLFHELAKRLYPPLLNDSLQKQYLDRQVSWIRRIKWNEEIWRNI